MISGKAGNIRLVKSHSRLSLPYQTLMKLIHELEYEPGKRGDPNGLTTQSLSRIATWCQDHGPFGVLLSRWESIALAPLRRKSDSFLQRRYLRGTGRSVQLIESTGDVGERKASVVLHELDGIELKEEEPGQTWHKFFPAVNERERDAYEYPMPYSSEFWYFYAERVFDFCKAARFLTGATAHLGADPPLVPNPRLELVSTRRGNQSVAPTSYFGGGLRRGRKPEGVLGSAVVAGHLCGDVRSGSAVRSTGPFVCFLQNPVCVKCVSSEVLLACLPLSRAEAPIASTNQRSQGAPHRRQDCKADCRNTRSETRGGGQMAQESVRALSCYLRGPLAGSCVLGLPVTVTRPLPTRRLKSCRRSAWEVAPNFAPTRISLNRR